MQLETREIRRMASLLDEEIRAFTPIPLEHNQTAGRLLQGEEKAYVDPKSVDKDEIRLEKWRRNKLKKQKRKEAKKVISDARRKSGLF